MKIQVNLPPVTKRQHQLAKILNVQSPSSIDLNKYKSKSEYSINPFSPQNLRSTTSVVDSPRLQFLSPQQKQLQDNLQQTFKYVQHIPDHYIEDTQEIRLTTVAQQLSKIKYESINSGLISYDLQDTNNIALKKFQFYYFKVKVFHYQSPLHLQFKGLNKLKIFLSTSAIFPSKFNSEHKVYAKSVKIHSDNGLHFTCQYVYLSVHSDDDEQLTILVHFGQQNLNSKSVTYRAKSNTPNIPDDFDFEEEYQRILEKRKNLKKDKLMSNLDTRVHKKTVKTKNSMEKQLSTIKHAREVKMKSYQRTEERKLNFQVQINTAQQIKMYREHQQIQRKIEFRQQYLCKKWIGHITLVFFCQDLAIKIRQTKEHQLRQNFGMLIARILAQKQLIQLKKFGQTKEQRVLTHTRMQCFVENQEFVNFSPKLENKDVGRLQKNQQETFQRSRLFKLHFFKGFIRLSKVVCYSKYIKVMMIQRKFRGLKRIKAAFYERIWRLIHNNIEDYIDMIRKESQGQQVQQKQIRKQYKQSKFVVDMKVMKVIIERFMHKKKSLWIEYYNNKQQSRKSSIDTKQIFIQEIQIEPKLFVLPDELELKQIIKEYYQTKQM